MKCHRKYGDKLVEKEQFSTLDEAIEVAKKINKRPQQIHKTVAYKCNVCFKYHIGKNKTLLKHE